jgi:hypothetical protein
LQDFFPDPNGTWLSRVFVDLCRELCRKLCRTFPGISGDSRQSLRQSFEKLRLSQCHSFLTPFFGPLLGPGRLRCRSGRRDHQPGVHRLTHRLDGSDLLPISSRIRSRLRLEALAPKELRECFNHLCAAAGNSKLMTDALVHTLCEHAAGNLRLLMNMANELLLAASRQEREQIDEALYFETFALDPKPARARTSARQP